MIAGVYCLPSLTSERPADTAALGVGIPLDQSVVGYTHRQIERRRVRPDILVANVDRVSPRRDVTAVGALMPRLIRIQGAGGLGCVGGGGVAPSVDVLTVVTQRECGGRAADEHHPRRWRAVTRLRGVGGACERC